MILEIVAKYNISSPIKSLKNKGKILDYYKWHHYESMLRNIIFNRWSNATKKPNPSRQGYVSWISYIIYQASRLKALLRTYRGVFNKGQGTAELRFYVLIWQCLHSESLSNESILNIRSPSQMVWNSCSSYKLNYWKGREENIREFRYFFAVCLFMQNRLT